MKINKKTIIDNLITIFYALIVALIVVYYNIDCCLMILLTSFIMIDINIVVNIINTIISVINIISTNSMLLILLSIFI